MGKEFRAHEQVSITEHRRTSGMVVEEEEEEEIHEKAYQTRFLAWLLQGPLALVSPAQPDWFGKPEVELRNPF